MPGPERPRGGIGLRVAARREQLGLSREEVALRTGSAPGYVQYLEEQPAVPGMGFLLRLADALETTVGALLGGADGLPHGPGHAAYRPELVELGPDECWELLGARGVGRVAVTTHEGPAILPVDYVVTGAEVAFRTSSEPLPGRAAGGEVAFEADRVDEAFGQGWSVLLVGAARAVTEPGAVRALEERAPTAPWAGAGRDLWTALAPTRVSGRRVRVRRARRTPGAPGT